MKKAIVIPLAGIAWLSACAEDGKLGLEGSPAWFGRTTQTERQTYYKSVCENNGFKHGTPEMAQCIEAVCTKSATNYSLFLSSNRFPTLECLSRDDKDNPDA